MRARVDAGAGAGDGALLRNLQYDLVFISANTQVYSVLYKTLKARKETMMCTAVRLSIITVLLYFANVGEFLTCSEIMLASESDNLVILKPACR